MNFELDPEKDRINQKTHGISFSTAKFVFNDGERWERYDSSHSEKEDRWQTIGLVNDENERRVYNGERNAKGWTKAN